SDTRELMRIEPDAHRVLRTEDVDVADAGNARQFVLHVARQPVGYVEVGALVGLVEDRGDEQQVRRALADPDPLLLNLRREPGNRRLDRILDLDLRDVRVDAFLENDADRDGPPGRR